MATFVGIDLNGYSRHVYIAEFDDVQNTVIVYKVGKIGRVRRNIRDYDDDRIDAINAIDDQLIAVIGKPRVLAIDAPLGYPDGFRTVMTDLSTIYNGEGADIREYNDLDGNIFSRQTELFIKNYIGLSPLQAPASWIAFIALRAMRLILRLKRNSEICVVPFNNVQNPSQSIIEVYPSATVARAEHNMRKRYKGKDDESRDNLLHNYSVVCNTFFPDKIIKYCDYTDDAIVLPLDEEDINHDLLDALICLYVAIEYDRCGSENNRLAAKYQDEPISPVHRTEGLIYY